MSLSVYRFCRILGVIMLLHYYAVAQDDDDDDFYSDDSTSSLVIEHSFDQGLDPVFTKRGTVTIRSITSGSASYRGEGNGLDHEEIQQFKEVARNDGLYRIKIQSKKGGYVSSFIKACLLVESKLRDTITVNLDSSGNVLGVSIRTRVPYCTHTEVSDKELQHFRTEVDLVQTVPGPVPETQSYIQKLEQEKVEKAKGQQADNRSFLAKYWMYIVPFVIFMMFAQSMDPGQGGGGGGR